jgi:hypothetical protein
LRAKNRAIRGFRRLLTMHNARNRVRILPTRTRHGVRRLSTRRRPRKLDTILTVRSPR